MKVRINKRGKAYTVRLPKRAVQWALLGSTVLLLVREGQIVLQSIDHPRAGWAAAAREMARRGDDRLIDGDLPPLTSFDTEEWEW